MNDFNPQVKPERCSRPGCSNEVVGITVGGQVLWSPFCKECSDAIAYSEEEHFQEAVRRKHAEAKLRRMNVPPLYWDKEFSGPNGFALSGGNIVAYEAATQYADNFRVGETSHGLIILGNTGTGKTHLAVCILKSVGEGFFVNQLDLLNDLRHEYSRETDKMQGYMDDCLETPLLILDDVSPDESSEVWAVWKHDALYRIANWRYEHCLPTVVTTNASMRDFQIRLGAPVVSRLANGSQIVAIQDIDHRTGI
jgi:DNA replication protein DnaC